ncbi:MAG: isochorismatase hydrolase [Candidatus Bathyarchaeota archaeon B63]|nr:MAG: isochorismatase hydrolase [Candidatus Bathyarchaeota archaeon B63]
MPRGSLLTRDGTILVVIDVQEKLFAKVKEREKIASNICRLIRFAGLLGVPVMMTEQYPKGLGPTIPEIRKLTSEIRPVEKVEFSCLASQEFRRRLDEAEARNLILTGIEAHICVAQTAIEALADGYRVYVVQDAVSSRKLEDKDGEDEGRGSRDSYD